MDLVTPGIGLIFWMMISFLVLLFILGKFAWKPILASLKKREDTISSALAAAEQTRIEIANLKADNEKRLKDAREERDKLIKEARDTRNRLMEDAREEARLERIRLMEITKTDIKNEIIAAKMELKNEITALSVIVAEKLLREELQNANKAEALVNKLLDEVKWCNVDEK